MRVVFLLLILVIIGYFAKPWFLAAVTHAKTTTAEANVKLFADAVERAKSSGRKGLGTYGYSKEKALEWYREQGLVSRDRNPDMSQLAFRNGIWNVIPTAANELELYEKVAKQFVVDWRDFLQAQGFNTLDEAQTAFGNLDEWARRNGYFCFNSLVLENYGGRVNAMTKDQATVLLDAAIKMPGACLPVIESYPDILTDDDLADFASLISQATSGVYGSDYPIKSANECLGSIVVNASTRPTDVWKKIDAIGLDTSGVALSGAILKNTNLTIKQINAASGYDETDFRGIDLAGFDPSKKSLRGARMPDDAASARLFRWTTGIKPSPGTVWIDGKRPWG